MEEISTPVETAVEDTSVATEPAEVADTSEQVTEPEQTTDQTTAETTTEGEQAPEEKLYAGKYKSVEELEKGYKETEKAVQRAAELEKRIQEYESKQPKYVNDDGKFNPEIKAQYTQRLDNEEFRTYVDLARNLDADTRAEVERLLGEAQRVYNPNNKQSYLNKLAEAKNYFNADIVEAIARNKMDLESKLQGEMKSYEQQARQKKADLSAAQIQKEPELNALVNPESADYSPEVFGIVRAMFDAYQTIDVAQTMKAINAIKELGVKQYKAQQEFETKKAQASVNTGENVGTQNTSIPSADAVRNNYQKYINKYIKDGMSFNDAMAKVDEIIMKG